MGVPLATPSLGLPTERACKGAVVHFRCSHDPKRNSLLPRKYLVLLGDRGALDCEGIAGSLAIRWRREGLDLELAQAVSPTQLLLVRLAHACLRAPPARAPMRPRLVTSAEIAGIKRGGGKPGQLLRVAGQRLEVLPLGSNARNAQPTRFCSWGRSWAPRPRFRGEGASSGAGCLKGCRRLLGCIRRTRRW